MEYSHGARREATERSVERGEPVVAMAGQYPSARPSFRASVAP